MNRAWWGHRLWQLSCLPEAVAFQRGQLRPTQERLLQSALLRQAPTLFGKRHRLASLRSYQEFRDSVPTSNYEDLLPYLQIPFGLSPEPVRVWEPTGGSSGGSKWIPWTATLGAEFRRAVATWIWHLLWEHPQLTRGRGYWQLTPKTELVPPAWLKNQRLGFEKDSDYLGRLGRWLERSVLLVPPAGPHLWDKTIDLLLASQDLRLLSCWSPSFLSVLAERTRRRTGRWDPRHWWPHLHLLSFWTQGPSAASLGEIRDLFPGVTIQPKGLLSTEAVVTIPLQDQFPLAYRSHFFEFETDSGILPAWELQKGQQASVVVTTGSGLTRYRTHDRVEVTGFRGQLPCLQFLGRDGVSDQRGEKLTLAFLEGLLAEVEGFAMLAFEDDGYLLFLGGERPVPWCWELVQRLEEMLRGNFSYADCRQLGQLKALRGFRITGDALAQYRAGAAQLQGGEPSTIKLRRFHPGQGWSRLFHGEFLSSPHSAD